MQNDLSKAAADVLAERRRQVSVEGWTAEHDDGHTGGEMAQAAACYAHGCPAFRTSTDPRPSYAFRVIWPWDRSWWKPKSSRENLVRAGALILAEIERLDRAARTCRFCGKPERESGCRAEGPCAGNHYRGDGRDPYTGEQQ